MRSLPFVLVASLAACSSTQKPRPPMGALPTAVTSAEPLWIPFRVNAGHAIARDPRETHFAELRRVTEHGHAGAPIWDESGLALRFVSPSDCRVVETVQLDTGAVERTTHTEPLASLATPDALLATECDATPAPTDAAALDPHAVVGRSPISLGGITNPRAMPTLSSDHTSLAFQAPSDAPNSGSLTLFVASGNGAHPHAFTRDGRVNASPTFTRDARHIVYASDREATGEARTFALYLVEPDGPLTTLGTPRVERITWQGDARAPRFSPDGKWLAFLANRGGGPGLDLYVARWVD